MAECNYIIILKSEKLTVQLESYKTVLQAILDVGLDAPFTCLVGSCQACKAKLEYGEVEMKLNHGLSQDEVDAGYILTCQSYPLSNQIEINYDK